MRADAPAFVPKSSVSQPTSICIEQDELKNKKSKKKKSGRRKRRANKAKTHGDTTNNTVVYQAEEAVNEDSQVQVQPQAKATRSHRRNNKNGRRSNNKGSRQDTHSERNKPTTTVSNSTENVKGRNPCRHSRSRGRNSRRQRGGNRRDDLRLQAQKIYDDDVPMYDHRQEEEEDFLGAEAFPSLLAQSGAGQHLNIDNGDENEADTKQWSSIAHQGHIDSEALHAMHMREYEIRRHEIETHTTMEILGEVKIKSVDEKDTTNIEMNHEILKENDTSNLQGQPFRNVNMTMTPFNVEKLRARWNKAFKEWQTAEEERQRLEKEAFDLARKAVMDDDEREISCSSDDSSLDDYSKEDDNAYSYANREEKESSLDSYNLSRSNGKCAKFLDMKFPLHYAVVQNDEEVVKDLILLPPQTTLRDERIALENLVFTDGYELAIDFHQIGTRVSVIHLAILLNRPNLLKIMLSASYHLNHVTSTFSLDDQDDCKRTPLMLAAEFSLDECIKVLLSYGPKLSTKHPRTGDCVMHIACRHADPSTIELILSRERNTARQRLICCRNRVGDTAIHVVASRGRIDILEAILMTCSTASVDKASAITDRLDRTPLLLAIISGASDIVNALLTWRGNQRGASFHPKYCPLTLAVGTKSSEMIDLILECRTRSIWSQYDYDGALCKLICCFEESTEDSFEVMALLIEEGADPYKKISFHSDESSFFGSSALEFAAMKGKVKFVAKMMDCYSRAQRSRMKLMREDSVLRGKNLAYFKSVEEKGLMGVQQALEDSLIKVMISIVIDEQPSLRRLGSCLAMIRRGSRLSDDKFVRFLRGIWMREGVIQSPDALAPDEAVFEGQYIHVYPNRPGRASFSDNPYDSSLVQYWTKSFLGLDWIRSLTSGTMVNCLNIKEQFSSNSESDNCEPWFQEDDESSDICTFIVEGQRLKAHRSILSRKSAKLEAAIRFAEMKYERLEEEDYPIEVHLDVSLEQFFFLVSHCYNGSIIAGLDPTSAVCCQQLLDLYFVANEYLCSSLAHECELRLLSKNPYKCYCSHCCEKVEEYGNRGDEVVCFYSVQGPSKLLSVDNYLGVVSSIQDIDDVDSCYSVVRKGAPGFDDASFPPLSVLKSIVWKSVLLNFQTLMKTESYIQLCHDTMANDGEMQQTPEYLEKIGDQFGALLLQMVLEQLTQIPPELVFMTRKSSGLSLGHVKSYVS